MKIQNVKQIKLNKIGTVAAVLILCCISFTAGVDLTQSANSAGSNSALPVGKGGTGANTFASGQALIGNGAGALTTRGIDASPSPSSTNLITSGGVNAVNQTALAGEPGPSQLNPFSKVVNSAANASGYLILGKPPTTSTVDNQSCMDATYKSYRRGGYAVLVNISIKYCFTYNAAYVNSGMSRLIDNGTFWPSMGGNGVFSLVTLVYNETKYVAFRYANPWNNAPSLFGYYFNLNFPDACTAEEICFLSRLETNNTGISDVNVLHTFTITGTPVNP
ncbi:MAG: hypothetical protein LBB07_02435 [Bifidobacteriaceae bacterium]|jgi:hypothetical protein|nr:hypothetical protein [Bifidobacteriaceae bacterium]